MAKYRKKKQIKPILQETVTSKKPSSWLDFFNSYRSNKNKYPLFKPIFVGSFALIFILSLSISVNTSINGDDNVQNQYSDEILKFYSSMGKDTSCFNISGAPIQYYGGLYEVIAGAGNALFNYENDEIQYHHIRHILNASFGALCFLILGLWLRSAGGWAIASLGLWLFFLSPRFTGHAMMNPKDIPFAAGYIMTIYFLSLILRTFPKYSLKHLLGMAAGLGIAFGVRVGGLVLLGYIGLFLGLRVLKEIRRKFSIKSLKPLLRPILVTSLAVLGGLVLGLLFWPFGLIDPFNHISETFTGLVNFQVGIKMLFQGTDIYSYQVPWYYHSVWILKTIPLSILSGTLLAFIFFKKWNKYARAQGFILALFTLLFPLVYVILKGSYLYDGWRHILFVYPSLVFIASVGWFVVLKTWWRKKAMRYVLIGVLSLCIIDPSLYMIKNSSLMYVYFNPLSGGIKGNYGKMEADYWGLSVGNAAQWMVKKGLFDDPTDTIDIVSNLDYVASTYLKDYPHVNIKYVRYHERHTKDWDYAIFLRRYIPGIQLREGIWPPKSYELHSIKSNNVVLTTILEQKDDVLYKAYLANEQNRFDEALRILLLKSGEHPDNEIIWTDLGYTYQNLGEFESAEQCFNKALKINPHHRRAMNFLAYNFLKTGNETKALNLFKESITINPVNPIAHFYLAFIYQKNDKYQLAINHGLQAIKVHREYAQAYDLVSKIYKKMGDAKNAQKYRNAYQKMTNSR